MPASAHRCDLLRKRLDAFTRTLDGVEEGDVRALHRARVASRRLRELVPVLQLDGETTAKLQKRLRKATARLGGVREADVLLILADEMRKAEPRHERAMESLRDAIAAERDRTRDSLASGKTIAGLRRLAGRLRDVLEAMPPAGEPAHRTEPAHSWTWAIDARVVRRASRLRAAIDAAGTVYIPERLHDVRIALKKLRYALELSADCRGQKSSPELRALRRGQDLLGRLHDLQVLIARARQLREEVGRNSMAGVDRLIDAIETDCRHLHARYVRERAVLIGVCDRAAVAGRRAATPPVRMRRSA